MLKAHVGGALGVCEDFQKQGRRFMDEIIELDTGESFLFSKSALLSVKDGIPVKLGAKVQKFRTRQRLTDDGGRSRNATEQAVIVDTLSSESELESEQETATGTDDSTRDGSDRVLTNLAQKTRTTVKTKNDKTKIDKAKTAKTNEKKKKTQVAGSGHPKQIMVPCRYFQQGNCHKGDKCTYGHN